jgi:hypothetical protein
MREKRSLIKLAFFFLRVQRLLFNRCKAPVKNAFMREKFKEKSNFNFL